jgi:PAS domain S-box-containing protein
MERLFEVISRTGDAVCAVDRGQRIVLWNPAARKLFGYRTRDVLGRPCHEILGGTDETGCVVCRKGCATTRMVRRGIVVPARDLQVQDNRGKKVWVSVSTVAFPSRWRELSVLAHLFRDVGRQKAVERGYAELTAILDGLPRVEKPLRRAVGRRRSARAALSDRERDVLALLATGASTGAIAKRLYISPATVRNHAQKILSSLAVHSRLEAVTLAIRDGLI